MRWIRFHTALLVLIPRNPVYKKPRSPTGEPHALHDFKNNTCNAGARSKSVSSIVELLKLPLLYRSGCDSVVLKQGKSSFQYMTFRQISGL